MGLRHISQCGSSYAKYIDMINILNHKMVGWLSLTSHRQRGHLETAPPFTVPCEGRPQDVYVTINKGQVTKNSTQYENTKSNF